ncbi:hypothetical protein L596_009738 [Steinernema carpocapsae]|uniref:Uncharacterized protein n=2 Tax=Steinernema carpocapsae TaxID=34508 RepID=A0A4V6A6P0_STECR|nr:hypothetical protein L596_009738 [Steinernema carpocapsae]
MPRFSRDVEMRLPRWIRLYAARSSIPHRPHHHCDARHRSAGLYETVRVASFILNLCDYCLWAWMTKEVYKNGDPSSEVDLKKRIRAAWNDLPDSLVARSHASALSSTTKVVKFSSILTLKLFLVKSTQN